MIVICTFKIAFFDNFVNIGLSHVAAVFRTPTHMHRQTLTTTTYLPFNCARSDFREDPVLIDLNKNNIFLY